MFCSFTYLFFKKLIHRMGYFHLLRATTGMQSNRQNFVKKPTILVIQYIFFYSSTQNIPVYIPHGKDTI